MIREHRAGQLFSRTNMANTVGCQLSNYFFHHFLPCWQSLPIFQKLKVPESPPSSLPYSNHMGLGELKLAGRPLEKVFFANKEIRTGGNCFSFLHNTWWCLHVIPGTAVAILQPWGKRHQFAENNTEKSPASLKHWITKPRTSNK